MRLQFSRRQLSWVDVMSRAALDVDCTSCLWMWMSSSLWLVVVLPSFFLIWGDTRSLRMPALRPASQAGPMRNPREETSVMLRDPIRLT